MCNIAHSNFLAANILLHASEHKIVIKYYSKNCLVFVGTLVEKGSNVKHISAGLNLSRH